MIPKTVGELRKLIADYPDDMLFDVDADGYVGMVYPEYSTLAVEKREVGYDGTKCCPIKADVLTLTVNVDA